MYDIDHELAHGFMEEARLGLARAFPLVLGSRRSSQEGLYNQTRSLSSLADLSLSRKR